MQKRPLWATINNRSVSIAYWPLSQDIRASCTPAIGQKWPWVRSRPLPGSETPPAQTRIGEAGTALAVQEGGVPLTVVLNYSHGERELYRSVEG